MKLKSSELIKYESHIEFDTLVDEESYAKGKEGIKAFIIRIAGRTCLIPFEEVNKFNIYAEENRNRFIELIKNYHNAKKDDEAYGE